MKNLIGTEKQVSYAKSLIKMTNDDYNMNINFMPEDEKNELQLLKDLADKCNDAGILIKYLKSGSLNKSKQIEVKEILKSLVVVEVEETHENVFETVEKTELKNAHKVIKTISGWDSFDDADLFSNESEEIVSVNYNSFLDAVSIEDGNGHELLNFS